EDILPLRLRMSGLCRGNLRCLDGCATFGTTLGREAQIVAAVFAQPALAPALRAQLPPEIGQRNNREDQCNEPCRQRDQKEPVLSTRPAEARAVVLSKRGKGSVAQNPPLPILHIERKRMRIDTQARRGIGGFNALRIPPHRADRTIALKANLDRAL